MDQHAKVNGRMGWGLEEPRAGCNRVTTAVIDQNARPTAGRHAGNNGYGMRPCTARRSIEFSDENSRPLVVAVVANNCGSRPSYQNQNIAVFRRQAAPALTTDALKCIDPNAFSLTPYTMQWKIFSFPFSASDRHENIKMALHNVLANRLRFCINQLKAFIVMRR